jgi:hypothetical protein
MYSVRDQFLNNKDKFFEIINGFKADFDSSGEHQEVVDYISSFFDLIENDNSFKEKVIDKMRTK